MQLNQLFKLSTLTTALLLTGCGGDINIKTVDDSQPTQPGEQPPTSSPTEEAYGSFAVRSTSITSVDGKEVWTLKGTLTGNANGSGNQDADSITLGNDVVWELDGAVVVGGDNANQTVLNIEEGTKILGNSGAYLVISRGSQIEAVGTASAPIVFTSVDAGLGLETDRGQWGGLVLLGNAPVNTCPDLSNCDVQFEVGNHLFGGDDETDNSGTLKYVRVENGGFKINDTQEMNGVSFGGVGSGTMVDYLQVDKNDDDGIEFWGGTVAVKHVVLTGNFDDSLDWTNGWRGAAQHIFIRTEDDNANRGIEADSSKSDPLGLPMSQPAIANATLMLGGGTNAGGDDAEGILFRVATGANVYSTLVKGGLETGECLEINGADTVANAEDGASLTMTHSLIDCIEPFKDTKDDADAVILDAQAWFEGQTGNITGAADLDGYQPNANSPALGAGTPDLANMDSRLDNTDYIGAFDGSNDWTLDWTIGIHDADNAPVELAPLTSCPAGTVNDADAAALISGTDLVCGLAGNITQDITLLAGTNVKYQLSGAVVIGGDNTAPATLGIQPGVEVYGQSGAYLVISRGSAIEARGTAEQPIVFTSEEDVVGLPTDSGQWGGLVLLGNGEVNTCPDLSMCDAQFEVGNHLYGGNDNTDSSGTLSHVVVKFGGFKINDTQEMNGISFAGVGSGTQVDHIQVHKNDDDGVEFWGGAVNLKYVYLTANFDDSLDWTNGWQGKAQYVYITQEDNGSNRGIEADSSKSDPLGTPFSNPMIANVTILPAGGTNAGGDDAEGMILRVATRAQLSNFIIKGGDLTGECLEIDDATTWANTQDDTLTMTHSIIDCVEAVKDDGFETTAWFEGQEGNVILTGDDFGTLELNGAQPAANSIALGAGKDMSQADAFFDATDYIGAFDGPENADWDWTAGWAFQPE